VARRGASGRQPEHLPDDLRRVLPSWPGHGSSVGSPTALPAGVTCNAHASGRWLESHGAVASEARDLLGAAAERLSLSARGYHRVLKVARTIADLEGDDAVGVAAVAEALRYRPTEPGPAGLRSVAEVPGAGAA